MKKRTIPPIICLLILLLFSSCNGSLSQTLNNFLNISNGNIYTDNNIINADLSEVNETIDSINSVKETKTDTSEEGKTTSTGKSKIEIKTDASDAQLSIGEVKISVPKEKVEDITAFAPPLNAEELNTLNTNVNKILSSETKTKELVQQLSQPAKPENVTASKGTFMLISAVAEKELENKNTTQHQRDMLTSLAKAAKKNSQSTTFTASDVLASKLVMGIITQISKVTSAQSPLVKDEAINSIEKQASLLLEISKKQIGTFDIFKLDGFDSLFGSNKKSTYPDNAIGKYSYQLSNSNVRETITKYRPTLYSMFLNLYNLNDTSFDAAKERALVESYSNYYTATLAILNYGNQSSIDKFIVDDLMKMATAVLIMQTDEMIQDLNLETPITASKFLNDCLSFNPWLQKDNNENFPPLKESDCLVLPIYLGKLPTNQPIEATDIIKPSGGLINATTLIMKAKALDLMMSKTQLKLPVSEIKENSSIIEILASVGIKEEC